MGFLKYHSSWEYIFSIYSLPIWQTFPFIKDKNYFSVINISCLLIWTCLQLLHQGDTLTVTERSGSCCSRNQRHWRARNSCPSPDHNQNTHHTLAQLGADNRAVPPQLPAALSNLHGIPHQLVLNPARIAHSNTHNCPWLMRPCAC